MTALESAVACRVRRVALPPDARALATLSRVDYEDAFLVDTGPSDGRTGEHWARAILEEAPLLVRRRLRWGWLALGLKLGRARPDRSVLGWEVEHSGPDYALLGAGSRVGMPAELLFQPQHDTLLFATFVQLQNPLVRAMWTAVAPEHQRVVPSLLLRAARSHQRGRQR